MRRGVIVLVALVLLGAIGCVGLGQEAAAWHYVEVLVQPVYTLTLLHNQATAAFMAFQLPENPPVITTAANELNYGTNNTATQWKIEVALLDPLPAGFLFLKLWTEDAGITLGTPVASSLATALTLTYNSYQTLIGNITAPGLQENVDLTYSTDTDWGAVAGSYLLTVNFRLVAQ